MHAHDVTEALRQVRVAEVEATRCVVAYSAYGFDAVAGAAAAAGLDYANVKAIVERAGGRL